MTNWIPQVGIMIFGVSAIFLVCRQEPHLRRWGPVCGLCSQPFWIWSAVAAEQWGILALTALYTYSWWSGLRTHWRKAAGVAP